MKRISLFLTAVMLIPLLHAVQPSFTMNGMAFVNGTSATDQDSFLASCKNGYKERGVIGKNLIVSNGIYQFMINVDEPNHSGVDACSVDDRVAISINGYWACVNSFPVSGKVDYVDLYADPQNSRDCYPANTTELSSNDSLILYGNAVMDGLPLNHSSTPIAVDCGNNASNLVSGVDFLLNETNYSMRVKEDSNCQEGGKVMIKVGNETAAEVIMKRGKRERVDLNVKTPAYLEKERQKKEAENKQASDALTFFVIVFAVILIIAGIMEYKHRREVELLKEEREVEEFEEKK